MLTYDNYIDSTFFSDELDNDDDNQNLDEGKSVDSDKSLNVSNEEAIIEDVTSNDTNDTVLDESKSEQSENISKIDFIFPCLIGKKIGMTQLFSDDGTVFPATVVEAGPCYVSQIKNIKNDGYNSVQIGYLDKKESKTTKSLIGHFSKSGLKPKKVLKEFRTSSKIKNLSLGVLVDVSQFSLGDSVTISGISKGKGFAGHMKRHGFSGGRASHGKNSVMRKAGSVGAGTSPGRIFPGMKMAGRMGNDKTTIKNLRVLNIDTEKNLLFIKGSVPGPNNRIIFLNKSI